MVFDYKFSPLTFIRASAPFVSELVNLQIFFMLVNSLKHLNIKQNKTMMVHYVKVEFYLSLVESRHYEEQSDEVIQYRVIPNSFRNLFLDLETSSM